MQRRVPFITFCTKPTRRAWINLAGCNFDCRGCFALAKEDVGRAFSVDELVGFFIEACRYVYGGLVDDVVITGGEPTLNPAYLIGLIKRLREDGVSRIALSTNGHLLDDVLVRQLKALGVGPVKLDIKAFSESVHRWYTGRSNRNVLRAVRLLHEHGVDFYARTILMPGIVDVDEVERIAEFLSSISPEIPYRIYEFDPSHARQPVTRKPTLEEMAKAFEAAKRHLVHVEAVPASIVYDSNYEYVEVRDDALLDRFKEIDEVSRRAIKGWKMRGVPFSEVLSRQGRG